MNPDNDKPTTPSPSIPNNDSSSSTASDDAALKAIDALESESNRIDGADAVTEPITPPETPVAPPTPVTPQINEPLTPPSPLDSSPTPDLGSPVTTPPKPIDEVAKDETPVIGSAAAFKPFEGGKKKSSKKSLIILVVIVVVLALGIGGFFGWQYLQSQSTPAATDNSAVTVPEEEAANTDSEDSINASIEEIESGLTDVDDAEYNDTTLNDAALYN